MEDRVTWESVGHHLSCPAHWMLPSGTLTEKHKNQPSQRSYQDQYVIVKNLRTCRIICSVSISYTGHLHDWAWQWYVIGRAYFHYYLVDNICTTKVEVQNFIRFQCLDSTVCQHSFFFKSETVYKLIQMLKWLKIQCLYFCILS